MNLYDLNGKPFVYLMCIPKINLVSRELIGKASIQRRPFPLKKITLFARKIIDK